MTVLNTFHWVRMLYRINLKEEGLIFIITVLECPVDCCRESMAHFMVMGEYGWDGGRLLDGSINRELGSETEVSFSRPTLVTPFSKLNNNS